MSTKPTYQELEKEIEVLKAKNQKYQKKNEALLKEKEEVERDRIILNSFFNLATDTFILLDKELNYLKLNDQALNLFFPEGTAKEDIIGKNIRDIIEGIENSNRYKKYLEVIETGNPYIINDFVPKPKFGNFHLSVKAIKTNSGIALIASDITKQVIYQQALKESEEKFKTFFELSSEGIILADFESKNISLVNRKICQMLGYTEAELTKLSVKNLLPTESYDNTLNEFEKHLSGAIKISENITIKRKDGSVFYADINSSLINLNGKNYLLGNFRDVTERIKRNQSLKESDNKFKSFFDLTPLPVSITNKKGELIDVNNAFCKMSKYSKDELIGKVITDIGFYDAKNRNKFIEKLETDTYVRDLEMDFIMKDKSVINALVFANPIILNKKLYILSTLINITERKRNEQALKESEEKFKNIFNLIPLSATITSEKGEIVYVNSAFCKGAKYTKDELIGTMISDIGFYGTKDREKFLQKLREEGSIRNLEMDFIIKDKSVVKVLVFANTILINKKPYILSTIMDITKGKKNEQALKESEERFATLFNLAPMAATITDLEGNILQFNEEAYKTLGYTRNEFNQLNINDFNTDNDANAVQKKIKKLMLKKHLVYETSYKTKSGELKNILMNIKIISINKQKLLLNVWSDITKLKSVENSLKTAQKIAKLGNWELDIVNNKLFWSEEIYRIFGVKQNEFEPSYEAFLNKIHPDDKEAVNNAYLNSLKTKQAYNIIHRLKLPSGAIKYVHEQCSTEFDQTGKPIKSIGIVQDITAQEITKLELKASEERFATLFNESPISVVITDTEGNLLQCNKSAHQSLGYTEKEFNQLKIKEIEVSNAESINQERIRQLAIHKQITFETRLKSKSGNILDVIITVKNITLNGQNVLLSMWSDLTRVKQAEKELKIAKLKADKANRLKSEFLANMSHEIRTPMNAIIGFSAILRKKIENPKYSSFIDKIIENGNNLLELINDILDLSKIEAGQLSIQKTQTNLYDLLNEIPLIFSEVSKRHQVPIYLHIDKNVPQSVRIDAARTRQVLINLVSNALKFTEKGSISIIVTSKQILESFDLIIEVKDSGIGIPENKLDEIFESFRQLEGQSSRKFKGTGLGLAITKHLVELMDGTISVKSTVGIGSTFKIKLNNIEMLDISDLEIRQKENTANIIFKNSKILHVEDTNCDREIVALYIKKLNLEIKEAITGKQALEILETYKPDLILMDIQLPELNGYETTKIIKKNKKLKSIPIVALTAHATKEEVEKYSSVFDEYLTKPINKDVLIKTIGKYLEHEKENIKTQSDINIANCFSELQKQKDNIGAFPTDFKNILKEDLKPLHTELLKVLAIDDLKTFVRKNNSIAKNYNIKGLTKYSTELQASINNFDFNKIKNLLNQYSEIINILTK